MTPTLMLYIVATPIGNLEDITLRAIRTLKEVDFVVAEDTRHSGILLQKHEIKTPQLSFHSHSPEFQLQKLIGMLREGKNLALISDAGTPGISDPGYVLIKSAIENGIKVCAIPGPSAVITAIVASGLPSHRFLYLGFLPLKKGRKTLIESLKECEYTVVFYEAPHRIERTLQQFFEILGDRQIAVCREMTKMFEEVFRGSLTEAIKHFEKNKPRGEFTIVLGSVL
jgi:16S rRNA (cytidine1402-2'-O)-methyltransferase